LTQGTVLFRDHKDTATDPRQLLCKLAQASPCSGFAWSAPRTVSAQLCNARSANSPGRRNTVKIEVDIGVCQCQQPDDHDRDRYPSLSSAQPNVRRFDPCSDQHCNCRVESWESQPVLPEHTAFSKLATALQLVRHERLLETRPTIGCCSRPARPLQLHPPARAEPRLAKTRGAAVPCPTATSQMLPPPAIRREPTIATTNFSREQ